MKRIGNCPRDRKGKVEYIRRLVSLALLVLLPAEKLAAQAASPEPPAKPITAPIDVVIPVSPTSFRADHKFHLAYELHISNLGKADCTLTQIGVVGEEPASKLIADFIGRIVKNLKCIEKAWSPVS